MKRSILLVAALLAGTFAAAEPALGAGGPFRAEPLAVTVASGPDIEPIPGRYLVSFAPGADFKALRIAPVASFEGGFTADLTAAQVRSLRHNANVTIIEQDFWHHNVLDATQTPVPAWGVDRIDQTNLPLSNSYTYTATGSGVHAYIIDTGIWPQHTNFGGRATFDFNSIDTNNTDCNNHGTHVAGTIGSTTYGVAKAVRLHGVKWLNCAGSGTLTSAVNAVNWVTNNRIAPAVANASWNFTFSATLATALTNMMNAGVFLAASAGNTGGNSCDRLPRNLTAALVVAATASNDARASFSSIGPCVDVYGPGQTILSTIPGGGTANFSGTSMSTPHAAGIGALFKQGQPGASQATVHAWIVNNATPNVVTGSLSGTPNRLLNKRAL